MKKSLSKSGDARTAAEKAADRFAAAKLSERRFSLTGAWAGSDWICNCRGRLNHGNIALCPRCDLRRPGMRHWMAQSIRWGAVATADHHAAARAYLSTALFCAPFHGGLDTAGLDFVDGKTLTPAATAETEKWAAARLYQRIVVTIALEDCPWPR